LGLISYCLVIYYPTKKSDHAGILTVLTNRIGDVCLLVTVAWFSTFGDFHFLGIVKEQGILFNQHLETLSFFVVLGAITKRAQFPFSS
jgi:NADH:ubiquinone oxidoreductase subunit 5 (subunit L)/multisubunit Na+/H+ antiporter MnhA subunit